MLAILKQPFGTPLSVIRISTRYIRPPKQEAEKAGYRAEEVSVALPLCGDRGPLQWLSDNWWTMVETVRTLASNYGRWVGTDNGGNTLLKFVPYLNCSVVETRLRTERAPPYHPSPLRPGQDRGKENKAL